VLTDRTGNGVVDVALNAQNHGRLSGPTRHGWHHDRVA
jgi:hypothetical protein